MSALTRYKEIFRIQCLHGYFKNRIWEALEVRPSPQCNGRLIRSRCLFRPLAAAGVALVEVKPDGVSLIEPFLGNLPFTFYVTGPRAQLETLTDMGILATPSSRSTPGPTVLYFNNLSDSGTDSTGLQTYQLLHSPQVQLVSAAIPVRPLRSVLAVSAPASALLELFDIFGNSVWKDQSPSVAMTRLSLNFTGIQEGYYRLQIDGVNQDPFYLCSASSTAPWAIIDIFPGGPALKTVPVACRAVSEDGASLSPAVFALPLPPSKSVWRYYIISTSSADRNYDGFVIAGGPPRGAKSNGSSPITFSVPVRQSLNGLDAWVFESDQPVSLYEYPADHCAVTLSANGKGTGLSPTALPFARAETSRLGKTLKGQIENLSEIFVYL